MVDDLLVVIPDDILGDLASLIVESNCWTDVYFELRSEINEVAVRFGVATAVVLAMLADFVESRREV